MLSFRGIILVVSLVLLAIASVNKQQADTPMPTGILRMVHLCAFSSWFGSSVLGSFIAGTLLIRDVHIDTFRAAKTILFDAYFRFNLFCLAAAGVSAAALPPSSPGIVDNDGTAVGGVTPFLVALVSVMANLVFFAPQTTITMDERRRACKDTGLSRDSRDPRVRKLTTRFRIFYGTCNLLNLVAIACGAVYLGSLAGRLGL